jgi:hypothetical protein
MVGSRAEKHHSSRVGKNWVMMGFCGGHKGMCKAGALELSTQCQKSRTGGLDGGWGQGHVSTPG